MKLHLKPEVELSWKNVEEMKWRCRWDKKLSFLKEIEFLKFGLRIICPKDEREKKLDLE